MGLLASIGDIAKGALGTLVGGTGNLLGQTLVNTFPGTPGLAPPSLNGGSLYPVNTGIPPVGVPYPYPAPQPRQVFPDIPYVPDLGDLQQLFQGQNPFTQGRSVFQSNGAGVPASLDQLIGSMVSTPIQTVTNRAPYPNQVVVTLRNGSKLAMDKGLARSLKLWKPRRKPPISAGDWNKLRVAERVKKKAKKIAETADFSCETKAAKARRLAKKKC